MPIRLQFVLGQEFSSRLIAWYGQGYNGWSHIDAQLPDGTLLGARQDAPGGTLPGVRIRPAGYEDWKAKELLELQVAPTTAASWEAWLKTQVGKPYDVPAIWGFILGREEHADGHWICSALQTGALEQVGLLAPGFSKALATAQIAPNTLHAIFLALGAVKV